ncbi:hypothetical protein G6F57_019133 [Rhizopus arrhizus]|nr:hypothetical protein G6F57_019133 [Rhizopus arrhizus]
MVNLLNYLDYDKAAAMHVMQDELGWQYYGGKHYESIYTRWYQGYYLPTKFGFAKRRAHLSALVCAGQITRQQGLEEMEQDPYASNDLASDTEFVLKKFGITQPVHRRVVRLAHVHPPAGQVDLIRHGFPEYPHLPFAVDPREPDPAHHRCAGTGRGVRSDRNLRCQRTRPAGPTTRGRKAHLPALPAQALRLPRRVRRQGRQEPGMVGTYPSQPARP